MREARRAKAAALVASSVAAQSVAATLFKLASSRAAWPDLGQPSWMNGYYGAGLAALAAQTVLWTIALKHLPLSRAYPFMACTIPLNVGVAMVLFDETIQGTQAIGLGAIAIGVWLVATGTVTEEEST